MEISFRGVGLAIELWEFKLCETAETIAAFVVCPEVRMFLAAFVTDRFPRCGLVRAQWHPVRADMLLVECGLGRHACLHGVAAVIAHGSIKFGRGW